MLIGGGGNYVDEYGQTATPYKGPSGSAATGPTGPAAPTPTASSSPVAPPPPKPPGTVQIAPAYTPDWSKLITSDPAYLSATAGADKAKADAATARKQALQQAIIKYGGLPSGFTDQYGDIDQATLDQAGQNQYSTLGQLARNYAQNEEQFKRGLAARGALQSSDLNYGEDQLQNAYGQQRYDAANATGSEVNNALGAYTGVLSGNAQNITSALSSAEANVYSNPSYKPTPAISAKYDAANSTTYGQPIYVDDSGNLFDQNGNPFTPPKPSGSGAPNGTPTTPPAGAEGSGDVYFNQPTGATQTYAPAYGVWSV